MKIQNVAQGMQGNQEMGRGFHWVTSDRTAGSIPSWQESKSSAKLKAIDSFSAGSIQEEDASVRSVSMAEDEKFGFADLVDFINPLQHIPLVNIAYRKITGDEIKPIGKIMGGAIYGGPAGVAGGLIDAVVTEETGQDMAGNALGFVKNEIANERKTEKAVDLAQVLLDQAPLSMEQEKTVILAAAQSYERISFADNRTAGSIAVYA